MKRSNGKTVKTITIDIAKCNGCRACEVICAAFHAKPQYSSTNPARSRIRVIRDQVADIYLPVYAGEYTASECAGRNKYVIGGREYGECAFCRAACPSRDPFHEPDSDLPLKCDMCESDPTVTEPWCVQWCLADALVYEEREVETEKVTAVDDVDSGLQALAHVHGWPKVLDAVGRIGGTGDKR
jgi:benzoyl-CoA reductase subunit BamC